MTTWLADLIAEARACLDEMPKTRSECQPGGPKYQRPCPWVTCRHHASVIEDEHGNVRGFDDGERGKSGRRPNWPRPPEPLALELSRLTALATLIADGRPTCTQDVIEQHSTPKARRDALER